MVDDKLNLLTEKELKVIEDLGKISKDIKSIIYSLDFNEKTASEDLREANTYIHALQQMVMSQAAGRAYPTIFRVLGHKGLPK